MQKYSVTWFFEEIISNYDDWKALMSEAEIVDYTQEDQASFDKYCYGIIARRFQHINVAYRSIQDFKDELVTCYLNKFSQLMKKKKIIDEIYKLTLDEMETVSKALSNQADNPNDSVDPENPIPYVSSQTYSKVKSNKLASYLNALNSIPTLRIEDIIEGDSGEMGIKDLFWSYSPDILFCYV